jgi:hypothetical protein
MKKFFIEVTAILFQNARLDLNPAVLQGMDALAGDKRIGIYCADNNASNFIFYDAVCAGRCFPLMAAWF